MIDVTITPEQEKEARAKLERESALAPAAGSARMYFFGVFDPKELGHFLNDKTGRKIWSDQEERTIPFRYTILDGGLLPPGIEEQGKLHLSIINGWTVLTMWDRTGDSRPASNSSFLVEGVWTLEQMKGICATNFPTVWARVQNNELTRAVICYQSTSTL